MSIVYPASWAELRYPWVREELILTLEGVADPAQSERWLTLDPSGPIIGIDEVFHFFFDDHTFDEREIGVSLLDADELAAIGRVTAALDAIHQTNLRGDSRYFLSHPLWPDVELAAKAAKHLLSQKGRATLSVASVG